MQDWTLRYFIWKEAMFSNLACDDETGSDVASGSQHVEEHLLDCEMWQVQAPHQQFTIAGDRRSQIASGRRVAGLAAGFIMICTSIES